MASLIERLSDLLRFPSIKPGTKIFPGNLLGSIRFHTPDIFAFVRLLTDVLLVNNMSYCSLVISMSPRQIKSSALIVFGSS